MVMIIGNYTKVSQVSGIETEIDLWTTLLYGFHQGVLKNKVEGIREKIRLGEILPRVNVIERAGEFYLAWLINDDDGKPDGGHHRAYAHYLEKRVLPVRIVDEKYLARPRSWIRISNLILRDI